VPGLTEIPNLNMVILSEIDVDEVTIPLKNKISGINPAIFFFC
jgi:hypothetical protein